VSRCAGPRSLRELIESALDRGVTTAGELRGSAGGGGAPRAPRLTRWTDLLVDLPLNDRYLVVSYVTGFRYCRDFKKQSNGRGNSSYMTIYPRRQKLIFNYTAEPELDLL